MRGEQLRDMGLGLLGFQWIYMPTCNWLNVEPWSLTTLGLVYVGVGWGLRIMIRVVEMEAI